MHFFNYTFTPFGILIVLFAIFFSNPEKTNTVASIITLFIQFSVNFYIFKNLYHFKKMNLIRLMLVLFNIITTSVVFYFIMPYWAPAWLLYIMPAVFAATFMSRWKTVFISILSSIFMLFVYWFRGYMLDMELSSVIWAMGACNSLFIIIVAVFINNMSEMMIKMRR